ncbi:MAG: hypothetical protein ACLQUT_02120 [Thermoleophilia bacterium]
MGLFGRGKDNKTGPVCAECGRTLLAGEWTQRVVGDDGEELLVCSLCSRDRSGETGPSATGSAGSNASRVKETRTGSDAFWKALKDKDAQIEHLESRLAQAEAERQELTVRLAHLQRQVNGEAPYDGSLTGASPAAATPPFAAAEIAPTTIPTAPLEPAPLTPATVEAVADVTAEAGLASDQAAAEPPATLTGGFHPYDALGEPVAEPPEAHPYRALEPEIIEKDDLGATMPGLNQAFIDQPAADPSKTMPGVPVFVSETPATEGAGFATAIAASGDPNAALPTPTSAAPVAPIMQSDVFAGGDAVPTPAGTASAGAELASTSEPSEIEADAASLTLLQRGVDLLNVSPVPKKISETNEHLGIPSVHVGFDGDTLAVTFLWSVGWYRYTVDIQSAGTVRLGDRGYDERQDLIPNAGVRADGTVQLAPARITRASAHPEATPLTRSGGAAAAQAATPSETPAERTYGEPAPTVNRGDIISKSLAGKRTDDEDAVSTWEQQQAREFKWDR